MNYGAEGAGFQPALLPVSDLGAGNMVDKKKGQVRDLPLRFTHLPLLL